MNHRAPGRQLPLQFNVVFAQPFDAHFHLRENIMLRRFLFRLFFRFAMHNPLIQVIHRPNEIKHKHQHKHSRFYQVDKPSFQTIQ